MSKFVVRNCPAYVLMRTATSGTYFNICGNAKGHIKCCDVDDCIIKQIVEKCKRTQTIFKESDNEFTLGKLAYAEFILKDLEIEEVNE